MNKTRQQATSDAEGPSVATVGVMLGAFCGLVLSIILLLLGYSAVVAIGSYVVLGIVVTFSVSALNFAKSSGSRAGKLINDTRDLNDSIQRGILVGQLTDNIASLRIFDSIGFKIKVSCDMDAALQAVANETNGLGLILIDYDHLRLQNSTEAIVSRLQKFRSDCPNTIVVLLSVSWSRDELGLHRLSIADASLRLPLSKARMTDGFESAVLNNIEWRKRVSEAQAWDAV